MEMTRAKLTKAQDLVLELNTRRTYRPGSVVRGMLKYKPKAQYSRAIVRSISLNIWGQTNVRFLELGGIRTRVFQDHAILFDEEVTLSEIYDSDSDFDVIREWKFEALVPTCPTSSVTDREWQPASPFLNINEKTSKQTLPSTFAYGRSSGALSFTHEAYTEYALTATIELSEPDEGCVITEQTTTVPFKIHNPGTDQLITDFGIKKDTQNVLTRSLQLISERQDIPLTLRQRLQTHLHASKIPQYSCNISIQHPSTIQLNNPTIPFILHAEPDLSNATTITPPQFPPMKITSFSLNIITTTHFHGHSTHHGSTTSQKVDIYPIYNSKKPSTTISPGTQELAITLPTTPFNLGTHLSLAISRTQSTHTLPHSHSTTNTPTPISTPFPLPLNPTFTTPSTAQTHTLRWTLTLAVTGTQISHKVQGSSDVEILAEARDGIGTGLGTGMTLEECVVRKVGWEEKVWAERNWGVRVGVVV